MLYTLPLRVIMSLSTSVRTRCKANEFHFYFRLFILFIFFLHEIVIARKPSYPPPPKLHLLAVTRMRDENAYFIYSAYTYHIPRGLTHIYINKYMYIIYTRI